MSVIYRAFTGLAAGAAAISAANAAAIDLAAFAGAGGDLSPKPVCRCAEGCDRDMVEGDMQAEVTETPTLAEIGALDHWTVLAVR